MRGAVRVEILSDDPARFSVGSVLYPDGDEQPLTIAWARPDKPGILLRFVEATSREAVERLRDRYLEALPTEPLPEGTWYWHQVEGLEVWSTAGEHLGDVAEVMRIGEAEVYVVRGGPRGEILVPGVRAIVSELLPSSGRMIIDGSALGLPSEPPPPQPPRKSRPPRQVRLTRRQRSKLERNKSAQDQPGTAQPADDQPTETQRDEKAVS